MCIISLLFNFCLTQTSLELTVVPKGDDSFVDKVTIVSRFLSFSTCCHWEQSLGLAVVVVSVFVRREESGREGYPRCF